MYPIEISNCRLNIASGQPADATEAEYAAAANAACVLTRRQHFLREMTSVPAIDAHLLKEQSCQISSRSDVGCLKRVDAGCKNSNQQQYE